jgi:c(7)-type cytochrome triheme protein
MKVGTIILSFLIAIALTTSAMAVLPGKTVEYAGGEAGKVVFKGDTHGPKQGLKCADCHPKPFGMKKGDFKMSKDDHGKADFCGKCHDGKEHNGTVVFSQSTEADCGKCHMKEAPAPVKEAAPAAEEKK